MAEDSILLVDDDPLVLRGIGRQLRIEGFTIAETTSGREAVARLEGETFDLVVTDLVMEKPDGLDLLEYVKRTHPRTAVIILTGYADVHAAIDALRLGADDYLLKPAEPDELLFRIRASIERRRLLESNDELGRRVADRTQELERLNAGLEEEVSRHKAAQTALSRSLREKEVLLREIQHRVKNNLATISGLINLQGEMSSGRGVPETIASLKQRVRAIHLIYEKLSARQNLARIDYRDYVEALSTAIQQLSGTSASNIEVVTDVERIELDIDTSITLGLITTELLSNALTHAFPEGESGRVVIRVRQRKGDLELAVTDNGRGLPDGLTLDSTQTLGFRLVTSLTEQMGGRVTARRTGGSGFTVRIPLEFEE